MSPGDLGERASKLVRPELAEQVRKANIAFFAFDPAAPEENMNVVLSKAVPPLTNAAVSQIAAGLRNTVSKTTGSTAQIAEATTFELQHATCGRIVYDFASEGTAKRGVGYLLPGATQLAYLTFTAPKDVFEQHRSLYEASVAATEGITQPPQPATETPCWLYGLIGAVAGGVGAATRHRKANKKKEQGTLAQGDG